jgi:drug/metabolite transporter (DMT)-like permease
VPELALTFLSLLWGTTFALVKQALEDSSAPVFLSLRFALAAAALFAVWLVRRDRPTPSLWKHGVLLGLFQFGGFLFQTEGLRHTTPARSAFISSLVVLAVPFLARFLLRRKVAASAWMAVGIAVGGLALLTRPFDDTVAGAIRRGDFLTLLCALSYGFLVLYTTEWSPRHRLLPLTAVQIGTTLVCSLALLPFDEPRLVPTASLLGVVAFTGLAMTAGAFFVMNWAQRRVGAVRAALIYSLEPVVGALFSAAWYGERLGARDWLGGALIVGAVLLGELGAAWARERREAGGAAVEPGAAVPPRR